MNRKILYLNKLLSGIRQEYFETLAASNLLPLVWNCDLNADMDELGFLCDMKSPGYETAYNEFRLSYNIKSDILTLDMSSEHEYECTLAEAKAEAGKFLERLIDAYTGRCDETGMRLHECDCFDCRIARAEDLRYERSENGRMELVI